MSLRASNAPLAPDSADSTLVLVIEEGAQVRRVLLSVLSRAGFQVAEAESREGPFASRSVVWLRHVGRPGRSRRAKPEPRVRIDCGHRAVIVEGQDIHLTPLELKLLTALAARRGGAMTEAQLVVALWGPGSEREADHLRLYVRQLRHKLEKDPSDPRHLLGAPGGGYLLRI
jgi:two-component system KDP operon response regulator KdpE